MLVRGEPGVGKSALLDAASRRAEAAGMGLLRATGVQAEARLPFAALHQLVLPVLDGADRLPDRQRLALLTAFGRTVAIPKPDRMPLACYSVVSVYNHLCLVCHGMSISAEVLV